MTVVGKINAYEFAQLTQKVKDESHVLCKKDRTTSAIVGALLGFEIGLAAMLLIGSNTMEWLHVAPLPVVIALIGAIVTYVNQCAEKEDSDYAVYPVACKYYEKTSDKRILKEECYVYDDYARLYVTAANKNGIVENFCVSDLKIATKLGIDDITVDLADGIAYIPYANE